MTQILEHIVQELLTSLEKLQKFFQKEVILILPMCGRKSLDSIRRRLSFL